MSRESLANRQKRAQEIIVSLKQAYPDAKCSLDFTTVHELMVATILSAQCTDERVNKVTPGLFARYQSVKDFAEARIIDLEKAVYTTGFYVNKAKSIKRSAEQLLADFGGDVPRTLSELTQLTGVGRKTGSVILGVGFGLAEGVVVDTHVGRISSLLKFTFESSPVKIERDLMKTLPKAEWIHFSHLMIDHGRAVCVARRPACHRCMLSSLCPSAAPPKK